MSDAETKSKAPNGDARASTRDAPEQQDQVNPEVVTDQAMWIVDQQYIASIVVPDATTGLDVVVTTVPTDVLAANVLNVAAYAVSQNILLAQGPPV